jgi:hypothetical protein
MAVSDKKQRIVVNSCGICPVGGFRPVKKVEINTDIPIQSTGYLVLIALGRTGSTTTRDEPLFTGKPVLRSGHAH